MKESREIRFQELDPSLVEYKAITPLGISKNNCAEEDVVKLIDDLSAIGLTHLYLDVNQMECETLIALIKVLVGSPIIELDIGNNFSTIGHAFSDTLATFISSTPSLKFLGLSGLQLSDEHFLKLLSAMGVHQSITKLDVSNNNRLTDESLKKIVSYCQEFPSQISEIILTMNSQITTEGVEYLLDNFPCSLKSLSLGYTPTSTGVRNQVADRTEQNRIADQTKQNDNNAYLLLLLDFMKLATVVNLDVIALIAKYLAPPKFPYPEKFARTVFTEMPTLTRLIKEKKSFTTFFKHNPIGYSFREKTICTLENLPVGKNSI